MQTAKKMHSHTRSASLAVNVRRAPPPCGSTRRLATWRESGLHPHTGTRQQASTGGAPRATACMRMLPGCTHVLASMRAGAGDKRDSGATGTAGTAGALQEPPGTSPYPPPTLQAVAPAHTSHSKLWPFTYAQPYSYHLLPHCTDAVHMQPGGGGPQQRRRQQHQQRRQ